jgi:outer membrane receptor protein involved in Fe transport
VDIKNLARYEPGISVSKLSRALWLIGIQNSRHRRQSRVDSRSRKTEIDMSSSPLFAAPSYATIDLVAYANFLGRLRLHVDVSNLLDRKYWERSDVRGRPVNDPVIDRYSRPGINARVSATYRF